MGQPKIRGPPGGQMCLPYSSPTTTPGSAPQGDLRNDTSQLLNFLCASLPWGFPHLTPPVPYPRKDEVHLHLPGSEGRDLPEAT